METYNFLNESVSYDPGTQTAKVIPVISSGTARKETLNALGTLTQAQGGGTNPALNRISDQVNQIVQGIKTSGGTLSSEENQLYNSINSLNGQGMSSLATANAASGSQDYRGVVGGVNQYNETEKTRAKQLSDLLSSLTNRTSDIETMKKLFDQTPEEQSTSQRTNELKSELRNFDVNSLKGKYALEDQNIPMPIIGRQQERLAQARTFERLGISNELAATVDLLNSQSATRQQKIDAAQFAFNANSQLLTDSINLYKMMAPENIATNVDKYTGEMTVVMRNPLTGETYKQNLGQVGTPEAWTDNIKYARDNGVNKPFFTIDGTTVINTQSGRAYSTPEQFFADGGAADFSNVQKVTSNANTKFGTIGENTDEYGNKSNVYGFIDEKNKTITPYNAPTGSSKLGTPIGTIQGLPSYDTAAANPGVNRPNRNNNPGNIKVSQYTSNFAGVIGVESRAAADGGNFLIFDSAESGIAAIGRLLKEGKSYQGVSAQAAIKKYNGNGGYGAADVGLDPNKNFQAQLQDPAKLAEVARKIAQREGFTGAKSDTSQKPFFGLPKTVYDKGAAIADDFRQEQIVKDFNLALNKKQSVENIISSRVGGPGDLSLVYEFMRALDPTSVVRETEYATAAKSGNIFLGAMAKFNGYLKEEGGFLPENVKSSFLSIVKTKFDIASNQYKNLFSEYGRRIDRATGSTNGQEFLTDYSKANNSSDPYSSYADSILNPTAEGAYLDSFNLPPSNLNSQEGMNYLKRKGLM